MTTAIIVGLSLAAISALAGLVYAMARMAASKAAAAAVAEQKVRDERDALEAERKAGAVLGEHRTVDDAAGRLRGGDF
ncbi:hypothetical protein [Phreatobacter sp.]|uniref:hypothetical protein n=1 Tax=Phreatobacter sp. TaxID=1966341 RepID=UPI003F71EDE9